MKDRFARSLALVALLAAFAAGMLGSASADSVTEPDAAALASRVADLEANAKFQQDSGEALARQVLELEARVAYLEEQPEYLACLAVSDRKFVRMQVEGRGPRLRLGLVAWDWTAPGCGPKWRLHR
jgi:hypothetical protein